MLDGEPASRLQVDLGSSRAIGAARAHVFGYPFWDALKGEVLDVVEVLTSLDGVTFTSQGLLQTSLWKKDVPINYMLQDDETATAWNFELTLPTAVAARYVRYPSRRSGPLERAAGVRSDRVRAVRHPHCAAGRIHDTDKPSAVSVADRPCGRVDLHRACKYCCLRQCQRFQWSRRAG